MTGARGEIAGSAVGRSPSVSCVGPADPNQVVEATIVIRRPATMQMAGQSTAFSSGKTRDEIEKSLSADAADIAAVSDFARRYGLTVKETSPEKRTVRVEGPVHSVDRAFGIQLAYFDDPNGTFLSYEGPLTAESDVAPRIIAVLGLHQQHVAKPRTGIGS
jgi:kumamolisin